MGQREPAWLKQFAYVFAVLGITVRVLLVLCRVPLFVCPERHKRWAWASVSGAPRRTR